MWIVAGPNGSGKTTLTNALLAEFYREGVLLLRTLNADDVTARLRATDRDTPQNELNLRAARIVDAQVAECIRRGEDFLVETVLSSGKYRDDVEAAKAAGFRLGMFFVSVWPADLSVSRVQNRVKKGGHHVDPDIARARYERSHAELVWFGKRMDRLHIFDNSAAGGEPRLVFSQMEAAPFFYDDGVGNKAVDRALEVMLGNGPAA